MIIFRGLAGIALSFCLTSAVSIITGTFDGRSRNIAFANFGAAQPVGFAFGLVLGGLFAQYLTWRAGFYIGTAVIAVNVILIIWALPKDEGQQLSWQQRKKQIVQDIDWIGAGLASTSLAMFSYVFA